MRRLFLGLYEGSDVCDRRECVFVDFCSLTFSLFLSSVYLRSVSCPRKALVTLTSHKKSRVAMSGGKTGAASSPPDFDICRHEIR
eukprot:767362-Hanusia_phi.AAC.1